MLALAVGYWPYVAVGVVCFAAGCAFMYVGIVASARWYVRDAERDVAAALRKKRGE